MTTLTEEISALTPGTPIYLHPKPNADGKKSTDELAFFGIFEGLTEEYGEKNVHINSAMYFIYNEEINRWALIKDRHHKITFPLTDIATEGAYKLYYGRDVLSGMMENENPESDLVRRAMGQN